MGVPEEQKRRTNQRAPGGTGQRPSKGWISDRRISKNLRVQELGRIYIPQEG